MAPREADSKTPPFGDSAPDDFDPALDPLLRIHYLGDVARVRINGKLIADDFCDDNAWGLV